MYIRIFAIIALLVYSPLYALEYTHNDGTNISVTIPSTINAATQRTIESEIRKIFPQKTTSEIIDITRLDSDYLDLENILETAHWIHTIEVKNIYSDKSITSVLLTSYEYTGGAHGTTTRIGLVMDTKTGKKLSPIWDKQIAIRLKKMIRKDLSIDEKKWIHDGTRDIEQYQSFTITPRVLTIYGQQYQHNAYAYGMQTLIFPRFKLIDIAK